MNMATFTTHLITSTDKEALLTSIRSLPDDLRPLYVGETKHWIHEPELSVQALTGSGPAALVWDYLIVAPSAGADGLKLPEDIKAVDKKWSIAAPVDDAWLQGYKEQHHRRLTSTPPALPEGWSATDHSGIDATIPPTDLSASLGLRSRPLGERDPVVLKDFIASFATKHTGPVAMFNLLSYMPEGGREKYYGYIEAFSASTGIKYGGEPLFLGRDVTEWSSKDADMKKQDGAGWVDCALVWYPSLWHFGKMLDDPGYAEADRTFKQGAIRDNPLICCTEVDVGYVD